MDSGRVLIVDDDAEIRGMLAEYLASHGFEVATAESGTAMREALARGTPDVVLLDVRLPGEDGLALARFLRERYELGIIMVTAAGEVVDRIVGLEMGADAARSTSSRASCSARTAPRFPSPRWSSISSKRSSITPTRCCRATASSP
jgi:CheY-like chemotaxis protein